MAAAQINVDYSRDKYLTDFGKATLDDRYLLPDEKYQELVSTVWIEMVNIFFFFENIKI